MIKNYFKIALRNLFRHKIYSAINITGLAIGIAGFMVMLLYVQDELTFDQFHRNAPRLYRLIENQPSPDQGERHFPFTMGPVGPALVAEFPEVTGSVRIRTRWGMGRFSIRYGEKNFYEGDIMVAEQNFLDVFDFKLRQGNPATALTEPNSAVLTDHAARKYFGDKNPLMETLDTDRFGKVTVTGVLEDPPANSHLQFDMLFSFSTLPTLSPRWQEFIDSWKSSGFLTYIVTDQPLDVAAFNAGLDAFVDRHRGGDLQTEAPRYIAVQPLEDIHFNSAAIEADVNAGKSDIIYVYIFSIIAGSVLLIACINYMNLATARSLKRAREIGIRKVLGAFRRQLVVRFLSESILLTAIALVVALAIVQLALPPFNALADKNLMLDPVANPLLLPGLALLMLLVGIISGSYPAFYLAGMRPASVFKNQSGKDGGAAWLRRVLVAAQFTLSIIMIVATLVAYRQLDYIREKNLGFNQDHLVVVDINSGNTRSNARTIKNEMLKMPAVKNVSLTSRVPGEWKNLAEIEAAPADDPQSSLQTFYFIGADEDFLKTFEIALLDGRNFSPEMGTDTSAVLINQTAAMLLGWDDPIGREIRISRGNSGETFSVRVVGVVKNFHFQSLHEKIGPLVLGYWQNPVQSIDYFTARVEGGDMPATLEAIGAIHAQFDRDTPFEYNFLNARLNDFYRRDIRVGKIFGIAAALAIAIACLGLLGLAAFVAEQRTKEIGIRKVLGASVPDIVLLLSKDFTILVALATLAAAPLAYYAMSRWLENFAYRIEIGWWVFALAGALALLIALLTVGYQAIRAALADPVKSLRYE